MFGERIKMLREDKDMTQKELGDKLGVAWRTISNWEREEREPNITHVLNLSKIFDVSTDYILGRTKRPTEAIAKQEIDGDIFEFNYDINKFPKGISKDEAKELLKKLQDFQSELMKNL